MEDLTEKACFMFLRKGIFSQSAQRKRPYLQFIEFVEMTISYTEKYLNLGVPEVFFAVRKGSKVV